MIGEGLNCGGLGFKLCLFFALNPDEYLDAKDICAKYGLERRNLYRRIQPAVDGGWLEKRRGERRKDPSVVKAGPTLLKAIGVLCPTSSKPETPQ